MNREGKKFEREVKQKCDPFPLTHILIAWKIKWMKKTTEKENIKSVQQKAHSIKSFGGTLFKQYSKCSVQHRATAIMCYSLFGVFLFKKKKIAMCGVFCFCHSTFDMSWSIFVHRIIFLHHFSVFLVCSLVFHIFFFFFFDFVN